MHWPLRGQSGAYPNRVQGEQEMFLFNMKFISPLDAHLSATPNPNNETVPTINITQQGEPPITCFYALTISCSFMAIL